MRKNLSKLTAMLLAFAMVFVLNACGSAGGVSATTGGAEVSAPSGADASASSAGEKGYADLEEVSITFITTYSATEVGGICAQYFMDYVTDATGGRITFIPHFGGTMASSPEELDYLISGSVQMAMITPNAHADVTPLADIPTWFAGGMDAAVEIYDYVFYENETSATLIADEALAAGFVYLNGCFASGSNAFFCTKTFSSVEDLSGLKAGVISNFAAYESLGMTTVTTFPPDAYENLDRGIADLANMGLLPSYAMRYHEVAPYVAYDGQYSVGNAIAANLDFWNSLPEEYQNLMNEAMKATEAYSIQICAEQEADTEQTMRNEGATFVELSEEDKAVWFDAVLEAQYASTRTAASDAGVEDSAEIILEIFADKLAELGIA